MEKTWADYRIEEMEDKAGIPKNVNYPEFDMDGCRFTPVITEEEEKRMDDAYFYSQSKRLLKLVNEIYYGE